MKLLAHFILSIALAACAPSRSGGLTVSDSGCGRGTGDAAIAQIAVTDGFLKTLCGCLEGTVLYRSGTPLTCTVASGTHVFFNYQGIAQTHQIVSAGNPSIPPSPLNDPIHQAHPTTVHVVQLHTPGTYLFQDQFDRTLQGRIIVP